MILQVQKQELQGLQTMNLLLRNIPTKSHHHQKMRLLWILVKDEKREGVKNYLSKTFGMRK